MMAELFFVDLSALHMRPTIVGHACLVGQHRLMQPHGEKISHVQHFHVYSEPEQ
jgi:hypothetical protein